MPSCSVTASLLLAPIAVTTSDVCEESFGVGKGMAGADDVTVDRVLGFLRDMGRLFISALSNLDALFFREFSTFINAAVTFFFLWDTPRFRLMRSISDEMRQLNKDGIIRK